MSVGRDIPGRSGAGGRCSIFSTSGSDIPESVRCIVLAKFQGLHSKIKSQIEKWEIKHAISTT